MNRRLWLPALLLAAVTLAVWLRGRCAAADVPFYVVAQILGAWVAAAGVLCFKSHPAVTPLEIKIVPALIAELTGTFALCYVVLNVATAKATAGNSNYGLAIGFTVMTMVFALGGISGGAFNPAVAVGITRMHLVDSMHLWLYFIANLGAGALAALVFKFVNPEDK